MTKMKAEEDGVFVNIKDYNVYTKHRNNGFAHFFNKCIKEVLMRKSIYEIIKVCYYAGYWRATRDMLKEENLRIAAENMVDEIKEQEK